MYWQSCPVMSYSESLHRTEVDVDVGAGGQFITFICWKDSIATRHWQQIVFSLYINLFLWHADFRAKLKRKQQKLQELLLVETEREERLARKPDSFMADSNYQPIPRRPHRQTSLLPRRHCTNNRANWKDLLESLLQVTWVLRKRATSVFDNHLPSAKLLPKIKDTPLKGNCNSSSFRQICFSSLKLFK